MDRTLWINKAKASGIHLAISTLIFFVLVYILIFHWYPLPFFHSDGGWQGLRIMLYVDVVLGPVLTLIVFNYKKIRKKIIFDLSVIGLIQLGALTWGVNTVFQGRPVAIVYHEGRFKSVEASNFYRLGVNINEIKGAEHPPVVAVSAISGVEDAKERMTYYKKGFTEILVVEKYEKIDKSIERIIEESPKLSKVLSKKESRKKILERYLKKNNKKLEDLVVTNYVGKFSGGMILFTKNGKYIDTLID